MLRFDITLIFRMHQWMMPYLGTMGFDPTEENSIFSVIQGLAIRNCRCLYHGIDIVYVS